jgi:NAD(P)-dependent dehydrogenase (short-subunit alcohol dehydrogenase family)
VNPRAAIVTGGGSGLGRVMAQEFVANGTYCLISGRRIKSLEETASLIPEKDRSRLALVPGDVTVEADRRRMVRECMAIFGRLDILVNNAGISFVGPLLNHEEKDWREVMSTNLDSLFFMAKAAIPHMRDQNWGRIINIASVYSTLAMNNDYYGGLLPTINKDGLGPTRQPAYHASKGGVLNLTRDLAVAVAHWGITVNAVSPGMFLTEQSDGIVNEEAKKALQQMTPIGRFGDPREVAHAVRFLASEQSSFITGIDLVVDGGWSLW